MIGTKMMKRVEEYCKVFDISGTEKYFNVPETVNYLVSNPGLIGRYSSRIKEADASQMTSRLLSYLSYSEIARDFLKENVPGTLFDEEELNDKFEEESICESLTLISECVSYVTNKSFREQRDAIMEEMAV